jgi:hypothetical protein
MRRAEQVEAFVRLVIDLGVSQSRKLVDAVALVLRSPGSRFARSLGLSRALCCSRLRGFAAMDPSRVSVVGKRNLAVRK